MYNNITYHNKKHPQTDADKDRGQASNNGCKMSSS